MNWDFIVQEWTAMMNGSQSKKKMTIWMVRQIERRERQANT